MDGITMHDVKPIKKQFKKLKYYIAFRISREHFFLK